MARSSSPAPDRPTDLPAPHAPPQPHLPTDTTRRSAPLSALASKAEVPGHRPRTDAIPDLAEELGRRRAPAVPRGRVSERQGTHQVIPGTGSFLDDGTSRYRSSRPASAG